MPYKPTGRRPGRPTKAVAEARAKETPTDRPVGRALIPTEAQIAQATGGLTPREMIATRELIRGASRSAAARAAGLSPSTLHPSRACGRKVLSAAMRALDQSGATVNKAAERLAEALDAEETKFFPRLAYTDRETGKPVIPSRTVVAHGVRLNAVKEAFKIMGAYQQETKDETDKGAGAVVAIEFVSKQAGATNPTEQRMSTLLDFAPRHSGDGGSE